LRFDLTSDHKGLLHNTIQIQ